MKNILFAVTVLVTSLQAHAFKFEELFVMTDPKLEALARPVNTVAGLEGLGNCQGYVHRLRISDLGKEENINVIFHEYLASLAPLKSEMDFGFIRYLDSKSETIKMTTRSMAPKEASKELLEELDKFAKFLSEKVKNQRWTYAGGVVHYVNATEQTSVGLINIRMLQDTSRGEFLIWGNGRCQ